MLDQYTRLERLSLTVLGIFLGLLLTPILFYMWVSTGWISTPEVVLIFVAAPILVLAAYVILRMWMVILRKRETQEEH